MQYANNNQVEDFLQSNGAVIQDFSGKSLEMKYPLKSENNLKKFLENKSSIKRQIEEIKNKLKFSKIICKFDFGNHQPSLELQKHLIQFQEDIFDEINVQMIKDDFDDFKEVHDYAINNTKKPISTLIDSNLNPALLSEINLHLAENTPANTRWLYHKFDSYMDRFRFISTSMEELGIDFYLTGCNKRYGGKSEFRDIDVSTICKGYFGFKGCCLDYRPANKDRKKGQKGFAPNMDYFEEKSYEWESTKNNNYRDNRLRDFIKLDKVNPIKKEIEVRQKVKRLFQNLGTLSP